MLALACCAALCTNAYAGREAPSRHHRIKPKEVAIATVGMGKPTAYASDALRSAGIRPWIHGSRGFAIVVPRKDVARAKRVLAADAKKHRYGVSWW
jgi:hypothetical protein